MRWGWLPLAWAMGIPMSATAVHAECCPVVELRQYTLEPGQRDTLVDVFERHFIESQEAAGMTLVGQFRDRRREDRFVWLRGFADMDARRKALESFYGGPVWAAHRNAANATMLDVSDVLLLKPARPGLAFRVEAARGHDPGTAVVLAGIYRMPQAVDARIVALFEQQVAPVLRSHGITLEGVFVTEPSPNTFPKLPVREGEHVLVWFGTIARDHLSRPSVDRLAGQIGLDQRFPTLLELEPTLRSTLGGGPDAARATKHDFDFLFGSWNIRNRMLKGRLQGATEWTEFDARSEVAPLLEGFGHVDRYFAVRDGAPFEGMTLRLFDPATGLWSIHWADTGRARTLLPPMVGRFRGGIGEFYGDETVEGRTVRCRFRWTQPAADSARWEQAFSEDGGKTWETNWIMEFTRRR
jgi:hypothetical protein